MLVARRTTDSSEVYANPDGTFESRQYVAPVRVRQGGSWVPVDDRLAPNTDGSWSPRAAVTSMRFSGGGSQPLISMTRGGVTVETSWPSALPAPEVVGDTATYRDVFPGVDLEVSARGGAASHRLIVKTRAAAADARIRSLTYRHRVIGGKRLPIPNGGGYLVTDPVGQPVFEAPEAIMWDSSAPNAAAATGQLESTSTSGARTALTRSSAVASDTDATATTGPVDVADEPREGDKVADMPVSFSGEGMTVTPSAALLDSPSTQFPVVIDPTTDKVSTSNHAMVDAAYPGVAYYKYTSADQGVGYQDFSAWSRKRLFYGFNTLGYNSTQIIVSSATFYAYEVYSATCAAGTVDAYLSNDVGTTTTWNNQPSRITGILSSTSIKAGRSDCYPGGRLVSFDVTAGLKNRIAAKASMTTIQLAGRSESTYSSWMRFAGPSNTTAAYRPYLSVVYNSLPAQTTTGYMKAPTEATACATTKASAVRLNPNSSTANMVFKAWDKQGGNVTSQVQVYDVTTATEASKGTVTVGPYALTAGTWPTTWQKARFMSGLQNDHVYRWTVKTKDESGTYGATSPSCYFIADLVAPPAPTITSNYSLDPDQLLPIGTSSVQLTFSSPGAASFPWKLAGVSQTAAAANTSGVTAQPVTVSMAKTVVPVEAQAKDAAAWTSAATQIWLNKAVANRLAVYHVNEPAPGDVKPVQPGDASVGSTVAGDPTPAWTLPLTDDNLLGVGRVGCEPDPAVTPSPACALNRAFDFPAASAGISHDHRPVRTDASFTIGAWIYVDSVSDGPATILAQEGSTGGYRLAYDDTLGRFTFTVGSGTSAVTAVDALDPVPDAGPTQDTERVGGWTYVAGSYDSTSSTSNPYGKVWITTVQIKDVNPDGTPGTYEQIPKLGTALALKQAPTQSTGSFVIADDGVNAMLNGRVDELSAWQTSYPGSTLDIEAAAQEGANS